MNIPRAWIRRLGPARRPLPKRKAGQVVGRNPLAHQRVFEVRSGVSYLVSQLDYLPLHRRRFFSIISGELVADGRIVFRLVFGKTLSHGVGEVQPAKLRIRMFEIVHNPQRLAVVFEVPLAGHQLVEYPLADVSKRRMAQVVSQRDRFDEVFAQVQGPGDVSGDLGDLERVSQPGAEQVVLVRREDLCFVIQPAKRGASQNPIAVALKFAQPVVAGRLGELSTGRGRGRRIFGQ